MLTIFYLKSSRIRAFSKIQQTVKISLSIKKKPVPVTVKTKCFPFKMKASIVTYKDVVLFVNIYIFVKNAKGHLILVLVIYKYNKFFIKKSL